MSNEQIEQHQTESLIVAYAKAKSTHVALKREVKACEKEALKESEDYKDLEKQIKELNRAKREIKDAVLNDLKSEQYYADVRKKTIEAEENTAHYKEALAVHLEKLPKVPIQLTLSFDSEVATVDIASRPTLYINGKEHKI